MFIGDSITAGWGAPGPRPSRGTASWPGASRARRAGRSAPGSSGTRPARGASTCCAGSTTSPRSAARSRTGRSATNIAAMARLAFEAGLPLWIGTVMPSDFWGWRPELRPVARIRALNALDPRAHCAARRRRAHRLSRAARHPAGRAAAGLHRRTASTSTERATRRSNRRCWRPWRRRAAGEAGRHGAAATARLRIASPARGRGDAGHHSPQDASQQSVDAFPAPVTAPPCAAVAEREPGAPTRR